MQRRMISLMIRIRNFLIRLYIRVYGCFHQVENKILFMSFNGKYYSDNPKAISEKMHELYPNYRLVWYIKDVENSIIELPEYVEIVTGKQNLYNAIATAFCLVNNFEMETYIHKRKGQFFVQTWHGDRAFKKVLYDVWKKEMGPLFVCDTKVTDVCLAASDYGERTYKSAFKYGGRILKVGSPRNDKLVNMSQEQINSLKKQLGVDSYKKILLYAPTFRDNKLGQEILINLDSTLEQLRKKGDDWICFVRAHPGKKGFSFSSKDCVDMSTYPDMSDLLAVADMLITDYSSCAGDFALRNKPIILTIYDKEQYEKESRAFNVDLEATGFILAYNQAELENLILTTTEKDFTDSAKSVLEFYGTIETGKSCEFICKEINDFYVNVYGR